MIKVADLLKNLFSKQKIDNQTQGNLLKLKAAQLRVSDPTKEDLKKSKGERSILFSTIFWIPITPAEFSVWQMHWV